MLPPGIEHQPRIQGNARYVRVRYGCRIELELKELLASSGMRIQGAQFGWVGERLPIGVHADAFGHGQRTFLPTGGTVLIRSANASELEKPPRSIQSLFEVEFEIPDGS